jgi:signal transduction histidine kinase
MAISISFSAFIYVAATREFDRVVRVEHYRVEHPNTQQSIFQIAPWDQDVIPLPPPADPQLLESSRIRVAEGLTVINLIILLFSALAGYFLAGRTLRPIKNMLDEQNRFITDASHELNTPLTSLKAAIEINLRDKDLTLVKAKDILQSNLEDVNNLQSLSAELIKLTQFQKQNGNFKIERVLLAEAAKTAVAKVKTLADKKQISISVHAQKLYVMGDKRSLTELLVILLDNAIKYSNNKKPVSLKISKQDGKVVIVVKDNGIGIARNNIQHIFDRFYRVDKSRTKQKAVGYGLGLSIAKRIVTLHNGNIEAQSDVGKGSTFTSTLPKA